MNQSIFRKTMFSMTLVCLILLVGIAWKVEVFQTIGALPFFPIVTWLIHNSWFCSICSSIIAVFLIYKWQVWYSKRKLRADFRCNEVIEGIYDGIETFADFFGDTPTKIKSENEDDWLSIRRENAQAYVEFYKKNAAKIYIMNLAMSYEGNDLLLDSIQSCFFINLNFELLSIMNHVKNRLPNLRKKYPEISERYERFKTTPNDEDLFLLGDMLPTYFVDLKLMATYWKDLFDYLGYDPSYIRLLSKIYNEKYSLKDDINQSAGVQNAHLKEVEKLAKKEIQKNKWSHFWHQ